MGSKMDWEICTLQSTIYWCVLRQGGLLFCSRLKFVLAQDIFIYIDNSSAKKLKKSQCCKRHKLDLFHQIRFISTFKIPIWWKYKMIERRVGNKRCCDFQIRFFPITFLKRKSLITDLLVGVEFTTVLQMYQQQKYVM